MAEVTSRRDSRVESTMKMAGNPAISRERQAGLGDIDTAFKWMETSFIERNPSIRGLKTNPLNDLLRHDPRYDSLLRRAGFAP